MRAGKYERAAALRDRLRRRGQPGRTVSVQDIAAAVSSRTGIPVGTISRTERQRLRTLEQTLSARVIGQEEAVHAAAEAVRRGRSGLAEQKRPAAAMLFLGPTGVGKTELCKALAEAVYGSEDAMIRVDMSEYMEKFTVSRLIGCARPGLHRPRPRAASCPNVCAAGPTVLCCSTSWKRRTRTSADCCCRSWRTDS